MWRWLAIALTCLGGAAAAEDLVVIESSSARYAVGAVIADGQGMELTAGGRVVLVGGSGRTVSLSGPYTGKPGANAPKGDGRLVAALTSLVQRKPEESGSVGAVRAADVAWRFEQVREVADVFAVDPTAGGEQCVATADAGKVKLVRSPLSAMREASILSLESDAVGSVTWPQGQTAAAWPADMPIVDNRGYLIEVPNQSAVTQLILRVLPGKASSEAHWAAMLAEAGCDLQGRLMLAVMARKAN